MLSKKNSKVIVIVGPTSSGKSSLAVKIAQKFKGEIMSGESRQIFKEMDLGTGKVSGEWRKLKKPPRSPFAEEGGSADENLYFYKNTPHHLIDFVEPDQDYNVSHFKQDCEKKIFEISERVKIPILCGGTGFWIQAVVDGVVFPQVKPNPKLRKKLADKSLEFLLKELKELDPKRAETIDKKNPARLIRAIEIAEKIGQTPEIKIDYKSDSRMVDNQKIDFLQIGIPVEMDKLEEKIKTRLKERFEAGMLEEIEKLFEKYKLSQEKIQNFGIAYALFPSYQAGKITKKELFEKICLFERQYAKRQLTWFKKDPRIFWSKEIKEIENKIKEFLNLKYS
jgi:tRNA dimethylallyltransferase